jgi:hypothetical protein
MKKIYDRLYYELYLVVSILNKDSAFFTIPLLTAMLFMNLLSLVSVYERIVDSTVTINKYLLMILSVVFIVLNYFILYVQNDT